MHGRRREHVRTEQFDRAIGVRSKPLDPCRCARRSSMRIFDRDDDERVDDAIAIVGDARSDDRGSQEIDVDRSRADPQTPACVHRARVYECGPLRPRLDQEVAKQFVAQAELEQIPRHPTGDGLRASPGRMTPVLLERPR